MTGVRPIRVVQAIGVCVIGSLLIHIACAFIGIESYAKYLSMVWGGVIGWKAGVSDFLRKP